MPQIQLMQRKRRAKYRRARVRHFLLTATPNRLSNGKLLRQHLSRRIVVREINISSPLWPRAFDGLRIGHVSDFHLGELLPIDAALDIVNHLAQQQLDLVAVTGDVVDLHHNEAGPLLEALANVPAPLGCVLVWGNHDELHCPDTLTTMAEDAGIHVLRNRAVTLIREKHQLRVAGIDWANSLTRIRRCVDHAAGGTQHLLLAHNPRAFRRAWQRHIPLTLSGHTHGGQIAMKNRPNANLALTHRRSAGLFSQGACRLYVTAGVGAWFPLRLNCPPEIAMITMHHTP